MQTSNTSPVGPDDADPSNHDTPDEKTQVAHYVQEGLLTPEEAQRLLEGRQI